MQDYSKMSIGELAEYVFGDKEVAAEWLATPNLALYNMSPNLVLSLSWGEDRVRNLLLRIEYGVLA